MLSKVKKYLSDNALAVAIGGASILITSTLGVLYQTKNKTVILSDLNEDNKIETPIDIEEDICQKEEQEDRPLLKEQTDINIQSNEILKNISDNAALSNKDALESYVPTVQISEESKLKNCLTSDELSHIMRELKYQSLKKIQPIRAQRREFLKQQDREKYESCLLDGIRAAEQSTEEFFQITNISEDMIEASMEKLAVSDPQFFMTLQLTTQPRDIVIPENLDKDVYLDCLKLQYNFVSEAVKTNKEIVQNQQLLQVITQKALDEVYLKYQVEEEHLQAALVEKGLMNDPEIQEWNRQMCQAGQMGMNDGDFPKM